MYWFFGAVVLFFMIFCPAGLIPQGQAPFIYYAVAFIELLLTAVMWCIFNFIDVYQGVDDKLYCYSIFGNQVNIPPTREIRSVPVAINWGTDMHWDTGYFSYRNATGKKRLKIFILRPENWGVIQQLPID
jgi:hypothetical protein